MRQTDNSDNSTGDRIENSATEITWFSRSVKAAQGNFICDRMNAKYIDVSRRKRESTSYVEILQNINRAKVDQSRRWCDGCISLSFGF